MGVLRPDDFPRTAQRRVPGCYLMAFLEDAPINVGNSTIDTYIANYETLIGRDCSAVFAGGLSWDLGGSYKYFNVTFQNAMDHILSTGRIPQMDWFPQGATAGNFKLSLITAGNHDTFLNTYAAQVASWGKPFFMRFAPEPNFSAWDYAEFNNGNAYGDYAPMWRHVKQIFDDNGATNATWVWCPNIFPTQYDTLQHCLNLYPGDQYVDWLGVDMYQGQTTNPRGSWRDVAFGDPTGAITPYNTYELICGLNKEKPFMLGETGCDNTNSAAGRARYFMDTFAYEMRLATPRIRSFGYFNYYNWKLDRMNWNGSTDVADTANSLNAYRNAIKTKYYVGADYARVANFGKGKIQPPTILEPIAGSVY